MVLDRATALLVLFAAAALADAVARRCFRALVLDALERNAGILGKRLEYYYFFLKKKFDLFTKFNASQICAKNKTEPACSSLDALQSRPSRVASSESRLAIE